MLVIGLLLWVGRSAIAAWRQPAPFNQAFFLSSIILGGMLILPQTGAYTLTLALIPAIMLMRYAPAHWLRLLIAASLLTPWLFFAFKMGEAIFLLIPLQFIFLQEIVYFTCQRSEYN